MLINDLTKISVNHQAQAVGLAWLWLKPGLEPYFSYHGNYATKSQKLP
jgi:hypothetical protein